jgi:hypothetical protein
MFKKDMTPLSKGGDVVKHIGKGSTQEDVPFPGAFAAIAPGDPMNRVRQDYTKSSGYPETAMEVTVSVINGKAKRLL